MKIHSHWKVESAHPWLLSRVTAMERQAMGILDWFGDKDKLLTPDLFQEHHPGSELQSISYQEIVLE